MSDFEEELKAYEKRSEEKFQEFAKKLTSKIPLFIAIGIAIWWIFYGTVKIYPTTLSITERIELTVCTIVIALTYCSLIADGGYGSAKKSEAYKKVEDEYHNAIKNGNVYKKEIIEYAKEIAMGNLYECRKNNLESVGLKYDMFFDEKGDLKDVNIKSLKLSRGQKKMLNKCINTHLIMPNLFGNISSRYFGLKKEMSQRQYQVNTTIVNGTVRAVVSIFSVGLMFEFIGFSIGSVIYALFQIVLWTASGFSQRMKNFNFVIDVLIPQLREKTLIINGYIEMKIMKGEQNGTN